jgi:hypothetical protein
LSILTQIVIILNVIKLSSIILYESYLERPEAAFLVVCDPSINKL